jgi:hypothetical protein
MFGDYVSSGVDTVHPTSTDIDLPVSAYFPPPPLQGLPPLKYEWYKDDRRLLVATADQPELVLVQVGQ